MMRALSWLFTLKSMFGILCLFGSAFLLQANINHFNIKTINIDLKENAFLTLDKISVGNCSMHCFQFKACRSIAYNTIKRACKLNNISSSEAKQDELVNVDGSIVMDKSEIPKRIGKTCADDPCPLYSKCIPASQHICLGPCDSPPIVSNASSDDGVNVIGKVRTYTCASGYDMVGSGTITCMQNSMWSSVQFKCIEVTVSGSSSGSSSGISSGSSSGSFSGGSFSSGGFF